MNEHSFARKIITKCRSDLPLVWKVNDNHAGGVPDALLIGPEQVVWVEFKFTQSLPKRDQTIVKAELTRLQISWFRKLKEVNQTAVAVLGTPKEAYVFTSMKDIENGMPKKDLPVPFTHTDLITYLCNLATVKQGQ